MDSDLAILFSLALPVAGAGHLIDMMPVISWASSSPLSSPSTRTGFNQASKASEVFFDAPKFPKFEALGHEQKRSLGNFFLQVNSTTLHQRLGWA
jgi:hypothetical protein